MTQVDVLAIFAHPDDVELSVGGTLLKMKSLGYRTGALDVTQGEMGKARHAAATEGDFRFFDWGSAADSPSRMRLPARSNSRAGAT